MFYWLASPLKTVIPAWVPYDETEEVAKLLPMHPQKMQYKVIQSKILDKNDIWKNIASQISDFGGRLSKAKSL
jgi:amidase